MANRPENYRSKEKWWRTTLAQKKRYYKKTAIYGKVPWNKKQDKMVMEHKLTDTELSYKIGHSVQAIQCRRYKLLHGLI